MGNLLVATVSLTDLGFSGAVPPRAEPNRMILPPTEARKRRASERHHVRC